MNLIRRVSALTAATAIAVLAPLAIGACGGASVPTNGLEQKSPADVLQQAAATLKGATSVHFAGTAPDGRIDARIQHDAATGTLTKDGHEIRITIIGNDGYFHADQAVMEMMGVPAEVQPQVAGRWVKASASNFTGFTLAELASQLTAYRGPLEPKVSRATLDGRQVVVVSWRDGSKLYVANTGPAYPLRGDLKGPQGGRFDFTEYGATFQVTAPANAIDVNSASSGTAQPAEPALIAVPGYEYADPSSADAAIAKEVVKIDPQHYKSASAHSILREGTMIGAIILMQLDSQYANIPEVQQAMVPAIAQGMAGSDAKVTQETIQTEKVAITSAASQDTYAWYHGGAITLVVGESGMGPEIRGFVEAYLKTANAVPAGLPRGGPAASASRERLPDLASL